MASWNLKITLMWLGYFKVRLADSKLFGQHKIIHYSQVNDNDWDWTHAHAPISLL